MHISKPGRTRTALLAALLLSMLPAQAATAASAAPEFGSDQVEFFKMQVQPLLAENCYRCHSHDSDRIRGGLVLDSRAAALRGGDRGPAIAPGEPENSLLLAAVRHASEDLQMPPKKRLADDEIAVLEKWIAMGAPWRADESPALLSSRDRITEADRAYWAFQPLRQEPTPEVADGGWSRTPIDRFIFKKLQAEGLEPAETADRRSLIRRAYFDLIGLPPAPEEVEAFVADPSPDAFAEVVDRLLESPHYGERWARHWLDLVRYAESDGYRHDAYRPGAWRYRDYVVAAFNDDKPYNRFVTEQLAADEIAPHDPDLLAATGYLRLWIYEYNQRNVRVQWADILNDVTDVTGDVFLGMGMSCARCHDHKFDPILQKDYFRLQAFFTPMLPRDDVPLATAGEWLEHQSKMAQWEAMTADLRAEIEAIEGPHREAQGNTVFVKFPQEIQEMIVKPPSERTPLEHQLAELAYRQILYEFERFQGRIKGEEKNRWESLTRRLAEFDTFKPAPLPDALLVSDTGPFAPPTWIPGDRSREEIQPGILTVLDGAPLKITQVPASPNSTGRRTALARWLTQPDNPLTTRVAVNRIWQHHFGRGLVPTASDFGNLGERPSHPELLDWLAREFVARGWHFKEMHRLIMNSAVYQQSAARATPEMARMKDPENRWLWRMNLRRLDGEQIRDAMLAMTGELDRETGGPSVNPTQSRRSIYTKTLRNSRDPLFDLFDAPDPYRSTAQRNVTTTPSQALLMINGAWVLERAKALAGRVQARASDDAERVREAYRLVLGREPAAVELAAALGFMKEQARRIALPDPERLRAITASMPGREGLAAVLSPDGPHDRLQVPDNHLLPAYDFTIESFAWLRSMPKPGASATIASRWDGKSNQPGWALRVAGPDAGHLEGTLLLDLVGVPDEAGEGGFETIASGLRIEPGKPYYAAVVARIADASETGITFYLKDLSEGVELMTAGARHGVTAHHHSTLPFTIGGLDGSSQDSWDGLIDDVRLSDRALTRAELLVHAPGVDGNTVGYWQFEAELGFHQDSSPHRNEIASTAGLAEADARSAALVDFCHVLMNSNESLYAH